MFKAKNSPLVIPPRFYELWDAIFYRHHPLVNVIAPTQDGKSMTISSATTLLTATVPIKVILLAPSEKKANIIMSYILEHATESDFISHQLELDPNDSLDRLRRERSKKHLTFKRGGGVMTLTLDARNQKRSYEAAMGFGAQVIIVDEAGLIDDQLMSTALRMLGGYSQDESCLIKIGNPFKRNHFYKSSKDPAYYQIFHDYTASIRDRENGFHGFDPRFIDMMRKEAFFDVYYECKFPAEDLIDAHGFRRLMTDNELEQAMQRNGSRKGTKRLGVDIGGGGDANAYVIRTDGQLWLHGMNNSADTMQNVVEIQKIMKSENILAEHIFVDDIGIGRGVTDRLAELGINVNSVNVGTKPNEDKYQNLKAEINWMLRQWIVAGGCVENKKEFNELLEIKYKENTSGKLMMESKEELRKRGVKSPNVADAAALTFAIGDYIDPQISVL